MTITVVLVCGREVTDDGSDGGISSDYVAGQGDVRRRIITIRYADGKVFRETSSITIVRGNGDIIGCFCFKIKIGGSAE